MNLAATMSLDAVRFTNPLALATSALRGMTGLLGRVSALAGSLGASLSLGGLVAGIKQAVDAGSELVDQMARTGQSGRDLIVLNEAFRQAGLGAGFTATSINLLQKAMTGLNEEGQPTNKAFERLGLNLDQLRKMSASEQLGAIGEKIRGLTDPAERAGVAMQIFGRSGGQMLQVLGDGGALGDAAVTVGRQAMLLESNAKLFDRASDIIGSIGLKVRGFFVGVADQVVPVLMPLLESFNKLDLASWGQKLGRGIAIAVQAFREGQVMEIIKLSLTIAFKESVNALAGMLLGTVNGLAGAFAALFRADTFELIGQSLIAQFELANAAFLRLIRGAAAFLVGSFEFGFQQVINRMPEALRSALGVEAKTLDFSEAVANAESDFGLLNKAISKIEGDAGKRIERSIEIAMDLIGRVTDAFRSADFSAIEIFNADGEKASLKEIFDQLAKHVAEAKGAVEGLAPTTTGTNALKNQAGGAFKAPEVDRLQRIGGFIGGAGSPSLDYAKRTADNTKTMIDRMVDHSRILESVESKLISDVA